VLGEVLSAFWTISQAMLSASGAKNHCRRRGSEPASELQGFKVAFLCGIPWASGAKGVLFCVRKNLVEEGGIEHSIVQMSLGWVDLILLFIIGSRGKHPLCWQFPNDILLTTSVRQEVSGL
jgi:hypothetical protein